LGLSVAACATSDSTSDEYQNIPFRSSPSCPQKFVMYCRFPFSGQENLHKLCVFEVITTKKLRRHKQDTATSQVM
jgi:hypothetical protein